MEKFKISGNYAHAVECEGHPTLIFDNTTNVCVVVYLTVTTKDGIKHPFTLLITDETIVDEAINELKLSYGECFERIDLLEPLHLKPYTYCHPQN